MASNEPKWHFVVYVGKCHFIVHVGKRLHSKRMCALGMSTKFIGDCKRIQLNINVHISYSFQLRRFDDSIII